MWSGPDRNTTIQQHQISDKPVISYFYVHNRKYLLVIPITGASTDEVVGSIVAQKNETRMLLKVSHTFKVIGTITISSMVHGERVDAVLAERKGASRRNKDQYVHPTLSNYPQFSICFFKLRLCSIILLLEAVVR